MQFDNDKTFADNKSVEAKASEEQSLVRLRELDE
jgi:hypothetical protein